MVNYNVFKEIPVKFICVDCKKQFIVKIGIPGDEEVNEDFFNEISEKNVDFWKHEPRCKSCIEKKMIKIHSKKQEDQYYEGYKDRRNALERWVSIYKEKVKESFIQANELRRQYLIQFRALQRLKEDEKKGQTNK